jgi:AbrB family looped-hinge helix DNA binding protein
MRSTVSERGQTSIPASLRERYDLKPGTQLEWLDEGGVIKVVPLAADPVAALRGRGRGERLTERLLGMRAEERGRGG